MFGKLFLAIGALITTVTAATFSYTQTLTFVKTTVTSLNAFSNVPSQCFATINVQQIQSTLPKVCSSADLINYFEVQNEPQNVATLFSFTGQVLGNLASSMTNCNLPEISSLVQSKSQELINWSNQIKGGAPVSLSQVSVVNGLKSMTSSLEIGLINSAAYDFAESINYDM